MATAARQRTLSTNWARHTLGTTSRKRKVPPTVSISGQMHIPVVRYDDGSFQVEPSAVDIRNKLQELGLLAD